MTRLHLDRVLNSQMKSLIDQEVDLNFRVGKPLTSGLFPMSESLLSKSDVQQALGGITSRHRMSEYRSMMDYVFAELVVGFRRRCLSYYDGKGPPLREIRAVTAEQLTHWDEFIASALIVALGGHQLQRRMGWSELRETTRSAMRTMLRGTDHGSESRDQ